MLVLLWTAHFQRRKLAGAHLMILNRLLFYRVCSWNSRARNLIKIFEKAKPPWLEKLGIPHCQPVLGYEIQAGCWMSCSGSPYQSCWTHEKGNNSLQLEKVAFQYQLRNLRNETPQFTLLSEVNVYTHIHRQSSRMIFCTCLVWDEINPFWTNQGNQVKPMSQDFLS